MLIVRWMRVIAAWLVVLFTLTSCAPFVPSNYLRPGVMQTPQQVNHQQLQPRLIPISAAMLETPTGIALLKPAMQPEPYRVGAFDSLNVIVWGHPEFSTIATRPLSAAEINVTNNHAINTIGLTEQTGTNPMITVKTDGTIFFPYAGTIAVAGLTVEQIQTRIANKLSFYLRHPQVTVEVARFRHRNVYVLGEVMSPGLQPLTDKPLSLMEALSNAGGINPGSADPSHIYLVRGSYQQPDVFWLNGQTPQALLIAAQFPLRENDIVYVPSAMLSPWNAFINQVLPQFSTYFTIRNYTR